MNQKDFTVLLFDYNDWRAKKYSKESFFNEINSFRIQKLIKEHRLFGEEQVDNMSFDRYLVVDAANNIFIIKKMIIDSDKIYGEIEVPESSTSLLCALNNGIVQFYPRLMYVGETNTIKLIAFEWSITVLNRNKSKNFIYCSNTNCIFNQFILNCSNEFRGKLFCCNTKLQINQDGQCTSCKTNKDEINMNDDEMIKLFQKQFNS